MKLHSPLENVRVLDGGLATELERRGLELDGPLWSARALLEAPEAILAVHRNFLEAGAECLLTASYQVSALGYGEAGGLGPREAAEQTQGALRRSVELARAAIDGHRKAGPAHASIRPVLIAASLGPYGAALHNGAEFHGNYAIRPAQLRNFHRERVAALAGAGADLLAFETVPSLEEARAIAEVLAEAPEWRAWVSFTCRDGAHTAHGEPIEACARVLEELPEVVALGINCTAPAHIAPLLTRLRASTSKPVVVYPNSGERWDPLRRCWFGEGESFGELAADWYALGAQAVGGCCRTTPDHIRAVAGAAAAYFAKKE